MGPPLTWRIRFGAKWWPVGQAMWSAGQVEQLPPTRASPPRVDMWQPRFGLNCLKPWPAGQGVGPTIQPLGRLNLGSSPTWSMCQIHPRGDDDFDIWSTSPYHSLEMLQFGT
jgi:hypothetical protein